MRDIVVARYKETDLEWIKQINDHSTFVYLYDKSGDKCYLPIVEYCANYIFIDNIGANEAHTYLQHIVSNYDALADVTIFCQAYPFDHCRDFLDRIKEPCENFTWLSHEMLRNEIDGHPHHSLDIFVGDKVEALHPDWLYSAIFHNRAPDYFMFGQGGMHMVTREQIHTKPVEFYQHIINLITGPFKPYKPYCALERFWDRIYLDPYY